MFYIQILAVVCLFGFFCGLEAVIVRDYNRVNFEEFDSYDQFKDKYLNADQDTLRENVMLGVATPECFDKLSSPAFRGTQRHSGGGPLTAVSVPSAGFPYPARLLNEQNEPSDCANIIFYRRGDHISSPKATTSDLEHQYLNRWIADQMYVKNVRFTNNFDFPVVLYWQEESTDPVRIGLMQPGDINQMSTFIGHIFSASAVHPLPLHAADPDNANHPEGFENIVDFMVADGSDYVLSPYNRIETCEVIPGETVSEFVGPDQTLDCSNMYLRLLDFTHSVFYAKRLGLNYVQPQFVEQVTPNGFVHRKLPPATYAWLKR
jgi:hypothetical protein